MDVGGIISVIREGRDNCEGDLKNMSMTKLSRSDIEKHIKTLLVKYQAEYAMLFGSYARGDESDESDIDVIVVGGANFRAKDIFAFGEELRQLTQKNVDAFEIREINKNTEFYENVMREGVRIA